MSIPAEAYKPRTVKVPYLLTNVEVEYVPAAVERPKAANAITRARLAATFGNLERAQQASVDCLSEVLIGWSHKGSKPTKEALSRQPTGWLGAAMTALGEDLRKFSKELEGDNS